jgi:hypothetical protein
LFSAASIVQGEKMSERPSTSRSVYGSASAKRPQALQQFFDQTEEFHKLGLLDQQATYCMGLLLGIYRYERESKSEFRSWCEDIPGLYANLLLTQWQERNKGTAVITAVRNVIRESCPEWTKWLPNQKP